MIITTRRLAELREECDKASIVWLPEWGRLELMDALRARLGAFDASTEIDPMKARDLKTLIRWDLSPEEGRYDGIASYLTPDYVAEPKLDGVRMRLLMGLHGNSLVSGRRSVRTYAYTQRTDNFPHLRDAVVPELAGVVLDCELLAPGPKIQSHTGVWTNSLLNASVSLTNAKPEGSVATQRRFGWAALHVFDVLAVPGRDRETGEQVVQDVTELPYSERRAWLHRIVSAVQLRYPDLPVHLIESWPATVESITRALEAGYEGVVLKKLDSPHQLGKRSPYWLKVKAVSSADAFICGYNPGENANEGMVGSLDLAVYEPCAESSYDGHVQSIRVIDGVPHVVRPVAQVGNLTRELRLEMTAEDGSLRPEWYGRVVEWSCQGIGKNGRARHANLVRLRPDKEPQDCLVDQLDGMPRV